MKQKNITIVVDEATHNIFQNDFETKTGGVQFWAGSYNLLKRNALDELKGYFTRAELTAISDCYNGTMLEPVFTSHPKYLLAQMEDFEKFENGVTRHGADYAVLAGKIQKLTSAQAFFIVVAAKSALMQNNLESYLSLGDPS